MALGTCGLRLHLSLSGPAACGTYGSLDLRPAARMALWTCGLRVLPAAARRVSRVISLRSAAAMQQQLQT
jgi:hypothetical protein